MRHSIIAATLVVACASAWAAQWVHLGSAGGTRYEGLAGSGEPRTLRDGSAATAIIGRTVDANGQIKPMRWYVEDADCNRVHGTLHIAEPNGAYLAGHQYVVGDGTVGGRIAEVICALRSAPARDTHNPKAI